MSSARRAYDILRGYVNHGWDHLAQDDDRQARDELRAAIEAPTTRPGTDAVENPAPTPPMTLEQARSLFELPFNATSRQITDAYDALRATADLSKFTEGSDAWHRARFIRRRLDVARNLLMENIDPTVRRFERLEIE